MGIHYTLEEQETIVRFDRTDAPAILYTASASQAERWRKLDYDVKPQGAHGWQALIPKNSVRFRKVSDPNKPKKAPSAAFLAARRPRKSSVEK